MCKLVWWPLPVVEAGSWSGHQRLVGCQHWETGLILRSLWQCHRFFSTRGERGPGYRRGAGYSSVFSLKVEFKQGMCVLESAEDFNFSE